MARELIVKDLLLPRCLLPATMPSTYSEQSNCATVAHKALLTVDQLLKALGGAPNALDSEDAKLATAVLPVLAHSALRCTGLSGPECHYIKALRMAIFSTLFKLQVKAPGAVSGSMRSVLQLLVTEQASRAQLLLLALTSAFVHRAHAALKAEVRNVAEREVAWGQESTFGKSKLRGELDARVLGELCKRWYCERSPPLKALVEWPRHAPISYPHDTSQMQLNEISESLPMLIRDWSAVHRTPELLKVGKCVEHLNIDAESQRIRQKNVAHGLHKLWLEHVAPTCAELIARLGMTG